MKFKLSIELVEGTAMQNLGDVKLAIYDALTYRLGREGLRTEVGDVGMIKDVNRKRVGFWQVVK